MDTIFATSSGVPPAAIAIVRMSGPAAFRNAAALAGTLPSDRKAGLRALRDPRDHRLLDRALVLTFTAPRTATGEDVVELHVHGGRAVVAAVEDALSAMTGMRRAEPGEFTRRALMNGIIDLTEAEGLGDLLEAETEAQRRVALGLMEGNLRKSIEDWSSHLVAIAAHVEAELDFSDEDDVVAPVPGALLDDVAAVAGAIDRVLAEPPVERLKDGVRIVLAGPPNSGKSTLINALVDGDVAIVSPIAGTTRDRIDVPVVRNGIAYVLTDTAGLAKDSFDPIEKIGIERARNAMTAADVVLWLGDQQPASNALWVLSRVDVPGRRALWSGQDAAISAMTGEGVPELWDMLELRAAVLIPRPGHITTNSRHRVLLGSCVSHLHAIAHERHDLLVVAERLRLALRALSAITGKLGIEALLDALFSRFCIGK